MNNLKTFLLSIMLIVCLGTGYHSITVEKDMPRLYEDHKSSSVSLLAGETIDINGIPSMKFFGATGFVVDIEKGYVFTAGHFARDGRLVFFNKNKLMKSIKVDTDIECAIFQIDPLLLKNMGCKEVKFATDVNIGDTIFVIGDPHQKSQVLTSGIICRKETVIPPLFNMGVLMSDALIVGGSSGSPVFNLEGKVIGCVVGYFDGFGLILPAQTIINFINSLNN